jgi:hypothetical protein
MPLDWKPRCNWRKVVQFRSRLYPEPITPLMQRCDRLNLLLVFQSDESVAGLELFIGKLAIGHS